MALVRFGIVGLGTMGLQHAAYLGGGGVTGATLAALCNRTISSAGAVECARAYPDIPTFTDYAALLASRTCDVVLIATPHYEHPRMIAEAFRAGLHVLVEKPLAVSIQEGRKIVADYAGYSHLKFGIMYNQRANPLHQKIRELVRGNALGTIARITWIITHWFRPNAYYASSPWRATWKGEGGGVLINQSIHNLDLLQWLTGMMPERVTAIAATGKFHPIEVEDDVSAILEYAGGATGHFVTTTGEFPGSNRLEIAGARGRILCENSRLMFTGVRPDSGEFCRSSALPFGVPETTEATWTFLASPISEHQRLTQNFVDVVQGDGPNAALLAPGPEGVHALELANAMLLAGLTRERVGLPLDGGRYEAFLGGLAGSGRG